MIRVSSPCFPQVRINIICICEPFCFEADAAKRSPNDMQNGFHICNLAFIFAVQVEQ